jgi:hypothetical protein
MKSICCICGKAFDARHSYGLCVLCFSKDRAREHDRIDNAAHYARRNGLICTLTLIQWLSTIADFMGLCAYCLEYSCNVIERVDIKSGFTADNVVPACRACAKRRREGYERAEDRVRMYLSEERVQRTILQREDGPA